MFQLRFWLLCAGLMVMVFVPIFRGPESRARLQQERLDQLRQEVSREAMQGDRLRNRIKMAEKNDYREREARRLYGYVRPGVIRFVAEGAGNDPFVSPEILDKDWAHFFN
jgi:cell division protein FtsB